MTYYPNDRGMARLFDLQSRVDSTNGNWQGASESAIDCIELGAKLPKGATLIGMLVGNACEEIGRKAIFQEKLVDHLDSVQAKSYAKKMAQINIEHISYADTLQEEKWSTQAGLLEMFHEPISTAKQPWPEQLKSRSSEIDNSDPIASMVEPVFFGADFRAYANLALDRLLEVQFALRAYYLDHHAYPSELKILAPVYLPSVPLDPFSENKPLKYKDEGQKYLLYSVGPDAVDNGGAPIDNNPYLSRGHLNIENIHQATPDPKALGDIVAGVNY
jgi:hypothetical protein